MMKESASNVYPEEYTRPFNPLTKEIKEGLLGLVPRVGHSPRVASVKVEDRCQLNCNYCDANETNGEPMTTQEIFKVEENLKNGGVQMLDITGGETTLRAESWWRQELMILKK